MGIIDNLKKIFSNQPVSLSTSEASTDLNTSQPVNTDTTNFIGYDSILEKAKNELQLGRKAIIDDPFFDPYSNTYNTYKVKSNRITNKTLKEISIKDWLVSAILQSRVETISQFGRPEHGKFSKGFRLLKRNDSQDYSEDEIKLIDYLEQFIYFCGKTEGAPDRLTFNEFLRLIVRDALVFGHIAVEKIYDRSGNFHSFRPVPAESVYRVDPRVSKSYIENAQKNNLMRYDKPVSDNDPKADQIPPTNVDISKYKYVQVSNAGMPIAFFGDEDMIFKLFNPQNFIDANGYCYSLLELAIINIIHHMNAENYNANFFTHGYAARGILHLKGTVTQANLANFRRQFYNSISGTQHAWRTPIVAGLDDVQWIPLSGSARDMEYINFNNHLIRAICSQFLIDPIEIGLDYLVGGSGRAPAPGTTNEYKINFSRERGLHSLLIFIEDIINHDILPAIDPALAEQYKFVFVGYTDETPQSEAALKQAELTLFKSMNDILKEYQKPKIPHIVADLPLNRVFWDLVERHMTKGEIRELFFNDKGASKRRELAYFPNDPAFLNWQNIILSMTTTNYQFKQQEQQMKMQQQMLQNAQILQAAGAADSENKPEEK